MEKKTGPTNRTPFSQSREESPEYGYIYCCSTPAQTGDFPLVADVTGISLVQITGREVFILRV